MKQLYLVRHAKSSWDQKGWEDIDRPLKSRGVRNAYEMGERLVKRGFYPEHILSSPANRALHTAIIMARSADLSLDLIEVQENLYPGGSREIMQSLRSLSDKFDQVMLFGHNPGITEFANLVTGEHIDNVPTSGFLLINFNAGTWEEVDAGDLILFDYPKKSFEE